MYSHLGATTLALAKFSIWHWAWFIFLVVLFLSLDLGVLHRRPHVIRFREAFIGTAFFFVCAMLFAGLYLRPQRGREEAVEFLTGYLIELSLSMDNVFVIALIFVYFRVPLEFQHRVLFWGILGALAMRGLMIWLGLELIAHFHWMLYVLGAFLLLTGVRMVFSKVEEVQPEKNPFIVLTRRLFPISSEFDGQRFTTRQDGALALTPLALVLVMVETTDLLFAVDSIPAIFAVTRKPFIVFTSNVFAILGLRSLYFVLAEALGFFRYLKIGLAVVLVFIGLKMLALGLDRHIPIDLALGVVAGIILISILCSLIAARRENEARLSPPGP